MARPSSDSPTSRSATLADLGRDVEVQVVRVVVGDLRRDRVPGQQLVEPADHAGGVVGLAGLEDRPQLALELPQQHAVPVGGPLVQPAAGPSRYAAQAVDLGEVGVQQRGRGLGVPDEVHDSICTGSAR